MKYFDYDKIWDFDHLYQAYKASRLGKRTTREVIQFEMNVGPRLRLHEASDIMALSQ